MFGVNDLGTETKEEIKKQLSVMKCLCNDFEDVLNKTADVNELANISQYLGELNVGNMMSVIKAK